MFKIFKSFFSPLVRLNAKQLARAAVIAALYSAFTAFILPFLSYGPLQLRAAEALTILPAIMPEAVIGVTLGCLLSNIFGLGLWTDMVFGTLATFVAAILTYLIGYRLKKHVAWAAIPPVLVNAIVIPFVIFPYISDDALKIGMAVTSLPLLYIFGFLSVGLGQAAAVYGLGLPLYKGVRKQMTRDKLQITNDEMQETNDEMQETNDEGKPG